MRKRKEMIAKSLKSWMTWCRDEQFITQAMNVSYMPDVSDEYRKGRIDGLAQAEAILGLLMFRQGIDLRG